MPRKSDRFGDMIGSVINHVIIKTLEPPKARIQATAHLRFLTKWKMGKARVPNTLGMIALQFLPKSLAQVGDHILHQTCILRKQEMEAVRVRNTLGAILLQFLPKLLVKCRNHLLHLSHPVVRTKAIRNAPNDQRLQVGKVIGRASRACSLLNAAKKYYHRGRQDSRNVGSSTSITLCTIFSIST